ncbi:hypothetical protein QKW35_11805 [Pontibacterium granulatum]|uniref:hypothetical protein n=1 Tax=Pontibacterium granulatum TaxID=2036029 RepID=UPI002499C4BD|nr:hypothetical protein [Pontibacterium granulatum]MDI3325064.1 hypothetical protein [Pontibacterium granulatum]
MRNLILGLMALATMPLSANSLPGDPTRPTEYKPVVNSAKIVKRHYALTYLMVGEQRKVAVINGKQVTPGSRVDGARVLSITTQGVRLRVGDQTRLLTIGKQAGFKKELSDRKRN